MKVCNSIAIIFVLLVTGCTTPPEVKQLSIKQMEYFDYAISAVTLQSEALIMAAEKLVAEAKDRVDAEEEENRSRLTETIQRGGLDNDQASDIAKRLSERSVQALQAKEKLDSDLDVIRDKADEIVFYLRKMKDIHVAIDSYVQSQKAGELVVKDVLDQPSVKTLLINLNELAPKIEGSLSELTVLLDSL